MAGSGIMPHEADKHLVAAAILLSRVDNELDKVPRDVVFSDRRSALVKLCERIRADIESLEEVRTGRKPGRPVPRTIAEVSDIDAYRAMFVDGVPRC